MAEYVELGPLFLTEKDHLPRENLAGKVARNHHETETCWK